jgi:hypothetical protein
LSVSVFDGLHWNSDHYFFLRNTFTTTVRTTERMIVATIDRVQFISAKGSSGIDGGSYAR